MEFSNALIDAISLAARAHQGQVDKAGEPYLRHVLRVGFSLLPDEKAAIVGILHDVLEDCPEYGEALWQTVTPSQYANIRSVTRNADEDYRAYIRSLALNGSATAIRVKIADLYDNLNPARLAGAAANGADVARLVTKYVRALRVLTGPDAFSTPALPIDSPV